MATYKATYMATYKATYMATYKASSLATHYQPYRTSVRPGIVTAQYPRLLLMAVTTMAVSVAVLGHRGGWKHPGKDEGIGWCPKKVAKVMV